MSEQKSSVEKFYDSFVENPEGEIDMLAEAAMELSGKDFEILKKRIAGKKEKEAKKGKKPESATGSSFVDVGKEVEKARDLAKEDKVIEAFWVEIEKLDPLSLLSTELTDAFKYIGFDPSIVLREFLFRGRKAGRTQEQVKKDMVDIVTIAIIKGSVTEKNLQKTSDAGKVIYKNLQETYNLVTGGAKGKDSTHLTVARVAAAVPGIVIKILVKRPEFSKTFVGPFGSTALPPYLRHQAAAACIPGTASEKLKEYLLGLITAFTADQTKMLSKSKDSSEELFNKQQNFVQTTFGGTHPTEEDRKKIFMTFSLSGDYDKLNTVAQKIKKVKTDFSALTLAELDAELAK